MAIDIPSEAIETKRPTEAVVTGISGPDLRSLLQSRFTSQPAEVAFEGDQLVYRWVTTRIEDNGDRVRLHGAIEADPVTTPIANKQAELAKRVNDTLVDRFQVYLGPSLPSLLSIPSGEEDWSYSLNESTGEWEWSAES